MADDVAPALDALIRSSDALGDAVASADPVALATALDARREAVEWLMAHRDALSPEVRAAMAKVAERDASLAERATESLGEVRAELAELRRAHGSLRALARDETPPRFVSRRA